MKYAFHILKIPDGTPLSGISVRVRQVSDGATITSGTTDANGYVSFSADGHYPPFYLHVEGQPGGDKFWRSDEHHGAGVLSLSEIPHALRAMGDGAIRGHLNALAPSLNNLTLTLATGTAMCAGYPVHNGTADQFTLTRPVTSTRIDRLVAWVRPLGAASAAGEAGFSVRTGVEGAAVTALVQTADLHEVSLATVTVPTAGALTLVDDRAFVNEKETESDIVRVANVSTAHLTGEALAGLSTSLIFLRSGPHVIIAEASCNQNSATVYTLENTYGSFGSGNDNFNNPQQLALDAAGRTYTADIGNDRVVIRGADGVFVTAITGLESVNGICLDSSDAIYVSYGAAPSRSLRKYNSALALQWTQTGVGNILKHLTTDDTHLYVVDLGGEVWKRLCSTGAAVTSWGSDGTGNGQFDFPWGITYDGTHIYVSDQGNDRIQKFLPDGTYVAQWATPALDGLAVDTAGNIVAASEADDAVYRYSNTGGSSETLFSITNPQGIAVSAGNDIWVTTIATGGHTLTEWDEVLAGSGSIALEIDGVVGPYMTIGERLGTIANADTATVTGPDTVVVRVFGKTTASTTDFSACVLSARAVPQR